MFSLGSSPRLRQAGWVGITDAYEEGHGYLVIKLGGLIPVKNDDGPPHG